MMYPRSLILTNVLRAPTMPRSERRARNTAAAQPAAARAEEAVVVTHDELRFDLSHGVHRDADHDQEARAPEGEVEAHSRGEPGREHVRADRVVERGTDPWDLLECHALDHDLREQRQDRQVERAHRRQAGQYGVQVVRGLLARSDARNELPVLPQVV